jgi:predicted transcriptional regulator
MKTSYDASTDSLYIEIRPLPSRRTVEIEPDVMLDMGEDGQPVGYDIQHALNKAELIARLICIPSQPEHQVEHFTRPEPVVPIEKSVYDDYIICLEDGKKLKMLKRHLSSSYGMTPEDYRRKWGLPDDYPMIAPNYAKARADMAAEQEAQPGQAAIRRHL